jgi:hypothetical protein
MTDDEIKTEVDRRLQPVLAGLRKQWPLIRAFLRRKNPSANVKWAGQALGRLAREYVRREIRRERRERRVTPAEHVEQLTDLAKAMKAASAALEGLYEGNKSDLDYHYEVFTSDWEEEGEPEPIGYPALAERLIEDLATMSSLAENTVTQISDEVTPGAPPSSRIPALIDALGLLYREATGDTPLAGKKHGFRDEFAKPIMQGLGVMVPARRVEGGTVPSHLVDEGTIDREIRRQSKPEADSDYRLGLTKPEIELTPEALEKIREFMEARIGATPHSQAVAVEGL